MLNKLPLFDSHFHIIDKRFPISENNGFIPDAFTAQQYLDRMSEYQLLGGAIISGSFQEYDYSYLTDALGILGANFVGIVNVKSDISEDEILTLNKMGVRGIRINLRRYGQAALTDLVNLAAKIYEVAQWHVEIYADSRDLCDLMGVISTLPSVSLDHLGLSEEGFKYVVKLIEMGAYIKATGFGRLDFSAKAAIINLYSLNPKRLIFGTDLPSTRVHIPYSDDDFNLVVETLGETGARDVLSLNALRLYRMEHLAL